MQRTASLLPLLCAALVLGALPVTATPATAAAACAPIEYQSALSAAAAALHRTPPDVAGAVAGLDRAGAAVPDASAVLSAVRADLGASPPAVSDAALRLDVLSRALQYPPRSVCHLSSAAARAALHDVYASPDFRHLDDLTGPSWLDRVLSFLRGLLGRAASSLGALGSALLALAVLGVAGFLLWRRWHGDAALRASRATDEEAAAGDDPQAEWRAAERAAAGGDHREAVRRAFRAALLDVAIAGRLPVDAAWTTRELLARCSAEGDLLAALAGAAALFDRAWYSGRAVSATDYAQARERCAAVRRLARQRRPVAP